MRSLIVDIRDALLTAVAMTVASLLPTCLYFALKYGTLPL